MKRLLLLGATGLVGSHLASRLLVRPQSLEVHALGRNPSRRSGQAWREHVAPAPDWPAIVRDIAPDLVVSALGTTRRKAGSESAFRAVDLDLVVDAARAAQAAGARQMVVVSSVGADAGSRNFYLRTKGEMERALEELRVDRLDIIHPGLLRGTRGADRRLGERIGIAASPVVNLLLRGRLDRFAAIDASVVAAAIAALLGRTGRGRFVHHNRELHALARA